MKKVPDILGVVFAQGLFYAPVIPIFPPALVFSRQILYTKRHYFWC